MRVPKILTTVAAIVLATSSLPTWAQPALVFQSDFGLEEPAVASMKGVAYGVSPELNIFTTSVRKRET